MFGILDGLGDGNIPGTRHHTQVIILIGTGAFGIGNDRKIGHNAINALFRAALRRRSPDTAVTCQSFGAMFNVFPHNSQLIGSLF